MLIAATAAEVFQTIGYVIIALLALMFMVVIHEFGHYLAGRLLGFKIEEFAIGFGPKIFKRTSKKTGTVFSIRPFPLGGFCQFEGEDEENPSPTAFNNQKPWKRIIVLFAGAFFNFISAIFLITLVFTFYGQVLPTVASVYDTAPETTKTLLLEGDVILRVNGKQTNIMMQNDFQEQMSGVGDTVTFTVLRNGETVKVTLSKADYSYTTEEGEVKTAHGFGFSSLIKPVKLNFFRALGRSFGFCFFIVYKIFAVLGQLITGQLGMEAVGGPVSVIQTITQATSLGLGTLTYCICLISANLAVMNLLPIPALDGSKILFTVFEWIFKKPIPRKVEAVLSVVGMFALFGFAIFADVFRFLIA